MTGRTLVVLILTVTSYLFPSVNLFLVLCGSLFGTLITIIVPVCLYNRAFPSDPKYLAMDLKANANNANAEGHDELDETEEPLLQLKKQLEQSLGKKRSNTPNTDLDNEPKQVDRHDKIRMFNYVILVVGCFIGLSGFIEVAMILW